MVAVSTNSVAQMTCPPTRMRPKTRAIGAPSPAPVKRNRSTRPCSTGSDPDASRRWSITRPIVAPTARPSTTPESPKAEMPDALPIAAPAADRRSVAIF
jgi:hypothetical protein